MVYGTLKRMSIVRPLVFGRRKVRRELSRMQRGEEPEVKTPLLARMRGRTARLGYHQNYSIQLDRFIAAIVKNNLYFVEGRSKSKHSTPVRMSAAAALAAYPGFIAAFIGMPIATSMRFSPWAGFAAGGFGTYALVNRMLGNVGNDPERTTLFRILKKRKMWIAGRKEPLSEKQMEENQEVINQLLEQLQRLYDHNIKKIRQLEKDIATGRKKVSQ